MNDPEDDDNLHLDPWEQQNSSRLDYRLVSTLVAVVDAGSRLLQVTSKHDQKKIANLWKIHGKAVSMILREIERRAERREQIDQANKHMRRLTAQQPVELDEAEEDELDDLDLAF